LFLDSEEEGKEEGKEEGERKVKRDLSSNNGRDELKARGEVLA